MIKLVVALLFSLLGASCLVANEKTDARSPESLISAAIDHEDFWSASTAPMTLRATIALEQGGKTVDATYELLFVSNTRWREEVRFANYSRIRVENGPGVYSQSMSANYQPVFMFWLDRMIHLPKALSLGSKDTLSKIHDIRKNGVQLVCSEVRSPTPISDRTVCFDPTAGTLAEIEYPTLPNSNPPEINRVRYSNFRKHGDTLIPFRVESSKSNKPVLVLQITEISAEAPPESSPLFNVPPGSTLWATCGGNKSPELATKISPQYPSEARMGHESGNVILYGIIEIDGSVSNLRLLQSASIRLDRAMFDAVRQWRYTPVTCGESPVRVETSIEANFHLN
jgi:TonB family protein